MHLDPDWTLTFHGSEISWASMTSDQSLVLQFAAAAVTTHDHADGKTEGFASGVVLTLIQARSLCQTEDRSHAELSDILGCIAEAHVMRKGQMLKQLRIPHDDKGEQTFTLRLISGTRLHVHAQGLRIDLDASASFQESLMC